MENTSLRNLSDKELIHLYKSVPDSKRKDIVDKFGFDVKFAGHIVRLLDEAEQILLNRDIDLTRVCEQVKAIHRGDVPLEEIERMFSDKEKYLTKLYEESTIPYDPDGDAIKDLLIRCLEEHFGSIDRVVNGANEKRFLIRDIEDVLRKHR